MSFERWAIDILIFSLCHALLPFQASFFLKEDTLCVESIRIYMSGRALVEKALLGLVESISRRPDFSVKAHTFCGQSTRSFRSKHTLCRQKHTPKDEGILGCAGCRPFTEIDNAAWVLFYRDTKLFHLDEFLGHVGSNRPLSAQFCAC